MRTPSPTADHVTFPASYGQQRLWILSQLDAAASRAHHLRTAVRLRGPLSVPDLRTALRSVVDRHEVLRTTFALLDETQAGMGDRLVQVVADGGDVEFHEIHLAATDLATATDWTQEHSLAEFDLEAGPLLRATVAHLGDEHLLALTLHHIAGDGWSLNVLARDLSEAYLAAVEHRAPRWIELPVQYADFAEWQRDVVEDTAGEHLEYWRNQLRGLPGLDLPVDRPRPVRQSHAGDRVPVEVPAADVDLVQQVAERHGVTPFTVYLATWALALGRTTGGRDLGVAVPTAGRVRSEVEGLVGFFVNTLVVRCRWALADTFATVLAATRATWLDAVDHEALPFDRVVDAVVDARDPSRPALAQAGFSFQNQVDPTRSLDLAGTSGSAVHLTVPTTTTEVGLTLVPQDGAVIGYLEYSTAIMDRITVERLARRWRQILHDAASDPGRGVRDLTGADAAEEALARRLSGADVEPHEVELLPSRLARQSRSTPGATAVLTTAGRSTYAELERRSRSIARALMAAGVRRGDVVGVELGREADLLASLWGVWRAGAAYLPLDPDFPADRRQFMTSDAGAAAVVDDAFLAVVASDTADTEDPADAPGLDLATDPADTAYVIYTSGSTGTPKGVVIGHAEIAQLVATVAGDMLNLGSTDMWAAVTTVSFDIAALELFGPLTRGATVALVPACDAADPVALGGRLATWAVTHLQATPSTLRELVTTGWSPAAELRVVLSGGEPLPQEVGDALAERVGEVWNFYGPTETTVWSCAGRVTAGRPISIGEPLHGETVTLLDQELVPVALGAVGEICIGGVGVGHGYLGRPGLTASRFVPDPTHPGARRYRTGDLGRQTGESGLTCLGRTDQQVKLHGHRIELGEIEFQAQTHDAVRAAVVSVRGEAEHAHLVGYVVPEGDVDSFDSAALVDLLAARLPRYMVPEVWSALEQFPLTDNHKVDRRALPDVTRSRTAEPPGTEMERVVLGIWSGLLQSDDIGVTDGFFALGGNSMLAARMVNEIGRLTGARVSIAQVFATGTVRGVCDAADTAAAPEAPPDAGSFDADVDALWDEEVSV